jgi:hypothetical protein
MAYVSNAACEGCARLGSWFGTNVSKSSGRESSGSVRVTPVSGTTSADTLSFDRSGGTLYHLWMVD